MKKFTKLAMGFLLLAVMIFANTGTVFAEGTTTIYLSTNDPIGVGDNISITIKASDSAPIKVLYTDSILGFVSCSNDSYSTSGNSITFTGKEATIKFSGAAEGKANVIVSSEVLTGSSAQVTVTGSGNNTQEATPAEDAQEEQPQEQTTEETTEASGEAVSVSGGAVGPITVGTPDSLISSALMETTLVLEDGTNVPAYRLQNTDSDFYYFYGMTEDGNGGWYSYDNANHTLQRADTTLFTSISSGEGEVVSGDDGATEETEQGESLKERAQRLYKNRKLLVVIAFVVLIGLIIFFNIRMKMRDDEFDDEEDDFFEEYGEAQARRDAIEDSKETSKEIPRETAPQPKVRTVVAGKEDIAKKDDEDISVDLSAALEETVRKTEHMDLSDAIVKQVTKPSKKDEDDLHIIDFNDL